MPTCKMGHEWSRKDQKQCLVCHRQYKARYYQENKSALNVKSREWYLNNPEKAKASLNKYRKNHWGKVLERCREYRKTKCPYRGIWHGIITRCTDPKYPHFHHYGGRGITVCKRWMGKRGYRNFESDIGPRPSPIHSVDRIDNNGNYEPGNVHWATPIEQANNTRSVVNVTIAGATKSISAWARQVGVTPSCFRRRVNNGWGEQELLLPNLQPQRRAEFASHI